METNETNVSTEETTVESTETVEEVKAPTKQELLREMSKEYGVNLFDAEGLQKFKEYTESQKSEQEKLQEHIETLTNEKATWESEKLDLQAQLKAVTLGIAPDQVKDALKLADGDPNKLEDVVKRYPTFQNKTGVTIGVQDPNNNSQPTGDSEVKDYMAKNPTLYKKYLEK